MPVPDNSRSSNDSRLNPLGPLSRPLSKDDQATVTEDSVLLDRIHSGDESAMASLFDQYSRMIFSVALRVLRDPAAAEDVMQDLLMQIWRNPSSFTPTRGSFAGWLAVSARNRAIDHLRRRKPTDSVEEVVLSSPYNLANDAEQHALMERAHTVIVALPIEQRKVLELAFFDGLTHSEIAELTGDPLGTVKTRIRAGLLVLRKAMQS